MTKEPAAAGIMVIVYFRSFYFFTLFQSLVEEGGSNLLPQVGEVFEAIHGLKQMFASTQELLLPAYNMYISFAYHDASLFKHIQ